MYRPENLDTWMGLAKSFQRVGGRGWDGNNWMTKISKPCFRKVSSSSSIVDESKEDNLSLSPRSSVKVLSEEVAIDDDNHTFL